jgi:hypothetical protein
LIDKSHIIREIKRIANANEGKAPGRLVFERETGINNPIGTQIFGCAGVKP